MCILSDHEEIPLSIFSRLILIIFSYEWKRPSNGSLLFVDLFSEQIASKYERSRLYTDLSMQVCTCSLDY